MVVLHAFGRAIDQPLAVLELAQLHPSRFFRAWQSVRFVFRIGFRTLSAVRCIWRDREGGGEGRDFDVAPRAVVAGVQIIGRF